MPAAIKPETWDKVEQLLLQGYNLTEIAKMPGMPTRTSMTAIVHKDEEIRQRIARARDAGWDARAERALTEARAAPDPARGRLILDGERWILSKMSPDRYGERIRNEISGPNGGPVTIAAGTADLPDTIAEILKLARDRAEDDHGDLA
jgi:hypothetical protein